MSHDAFSRRHPAVIFLFFAGAIVSAALIQHPAYLAAGIIGGSAYYLLLHGRNGWKRLAGMIPLFVTLTLINPLFNRYGNTVLFRYFGYPYTLEALFYGATIAAVFVEMLLWFGCCGVAFTSEKFTALFGKLIPALSLLLVMVLRMIPGLLRKARQIGLARRSVGRGVVEQDGTKAKLMEGMTVLGALTSWALEGSIVTADSMRSRGYGSGRCTSFSPDRITPADWWLLAAELLLPAAVAVLSSTTATYTPTLYIAPVTEKNAAGLVAYTVYLLIPTLTYLKEAVQWHISVSKI